MQNPTRREIMVLLKRSGGMTVEQLSSAIGITAMGVRQHLAVLERDGLIEMSKRRGGMGRPAHVYTLTGKGDGLFPRHYEAFALTILDTLQQLDGDAKVETVLRKRTERMRDLLALRLTARSLPERLEELVRLQEENGYMAELQERPEGLVFCQYNCTIAQVARRFPSICRMEHEMFESLLGTRLERRHCLADGDSCCAFVVPRAPVATEAAAAR